MAVAVVTNDRVNVDPYQTGGIPAVRNAWRIARRPHTGVNRWQEIRRIIRIEWHDRIRRLRGRL